MNPKLMNGNLSNSRYIFCRENEMLALPVHHHQELSFPQHMDFLQPTALALLPGVARWNYRQLASIRLQNRLHVLSRSANCQPG